MEQERIYRPIFSHRLQRLSGFPLRLDVRNPSTNGAFYTSLGREPQENEPRRPEG